MNSRILEFIKKNNMFEKGDGVIAGVSGGADSMCMLLCLLELRATFSLSIEVVHVNHGIRGAEADADEKYVKDFCDARGVGFTAIHADVTAIAKTEGITTEEAGRNLRYSVFASRARELGYTKVAVAHNSDDVAETILFNIIRGTGIKGLGGIRPVVSRDGVSVVRPLLSTSRAVIEEILKEQGIAYRTDATNLLDEYSRNKLRNTVIPMISESINPAAVLHLCDLGREAAETQDYIDMQADREYSGATTDGRITISTDEVSFSCTFLASLHPVIAGNIVRRLLRQLTGSLKDIERIHIESVIGLTEKSSSSRVDLPYGLRAVRCYDRVIISRADEESPVTDPSKQFAYTVYEGDAIGDIKELLTKDKNSDESNKLYTKWFDYDKIKDRFEFRFARQGDEMLISMDGRLCHKQLSKVFKDAKLPADLRDRTALVAVGNHVLWVPGVRRDDSCLVTESTTGILEIRYISEP